MTDVPFGSTQEQLTEYVPEQCRPCHRAGLAVSYAAERVVAGEVTVEKAGADLQSDFNKNCRYGADDRGGCFGGIQCNYGVLCQFPPSQNPLLAPDNSL